MRLCTSLRHHTRVTTAISPRRKSFAKLEEGTLNCKEQHNRYGVDKQLDSN